MSEKNGTTPAPESATVSCNRSWCVVGQTSPEEHYDHHAGRVVTLRNGEDETWSGYLLERGGEPVMLVLETDSRDQHGRKRFEIPAWQVDELLAIGDDARSAAGLSELLSEAT